MIKCMLLYILNLFSKHFVAIIYLFSFSYFPFSTSVEYIYPARGIPGIGSDLPYKTQNSRLNPQLIRLMSYNVRVDHEQDSNSENQWSVRRPILEEVITKYDGDILALQEPNERQIFDLKETFGDKYAIYYAKASERAYEKPEDFISEQHRETMAIFWQKERFTSFDNGRFWLAPQPDQEPDKIAWDGSPFTRVAIYVGLEDRLTGQRFYLVTAHFDHLGLAARVNSAHLIMNKALEISQTLPVFVCGDFNTFEHGFGGPETFNAFSEYFDKFDDIRTIAKENLGTNATWVGWDYNPFNEVLLKQQYPELSARWDHLFISKSNINVLRTAVPDDRFVIEWDHAKKTVYPSDHRPIVCDFLFGRK